MIQAVSAVFIYQDEMYMIKRQNFLRAFPGYHAFPGGKVDADESDEVFKTEQLTRFPAVLMRALCRELQEELSYDLESEIKKGNISSIIQIGTAITPSFQRLRIKAHHFKIVLKNRPELEADAQEASWGGWKPITEILENLRTGKIIMVIPTRNILEHLHKDINTSVIEPLNSVFDTEIEVPHLDIISGVEIFFVASNTIPPAQFTNALVIGDSGTPPILIDPSPKNHKELTKLIYSLKHKIPQKIILTHHHQDHHEFVPELARQLDLPVAMSFNTKSRLLALNVDYFKDISTEFIKEGDVVAQWLGKNVRVYETPGHDDGQIGLAPDSMEWFLVGDLIQEVGTVVIKEPEGDMTQYMSSLQRVMDLNPDFIIPSHGIILGGTEKLKQTWEHRLERENQVLKLIKEGRSINEILGIIYQDVDPSLHPLASQNIRQHMKKLSHEGKLDNLEILEKNNLFPRR